MPGRWHSNLPWTEKPQPAHFPQGCHLRTSNGGCLRHRDSTRTCGRAAARAQLSFPLLSLMYEGQVNLWQFRAAGHSCPGQFTATWAQVVFLLSPPPNTCLPRWRRKPPAGVAFLEAGDASKREVTPGRASSYRKQHGDRDSGRGAPTLSHPFLLRLTSSLTLEV